MTCGILFQLGGMWIGAHYSKANKRLCVNLILCVTIYFVLPDGNPPFKEIK